MAATASAQSCAVYPIALSSQSLASVTPGTILADIWNGVQPGNFGWLSWTGDAGEPTLANSLTQPGDSITYINPNDANDRTLRSGVWVSARPGVANGKHVRAALDALKPVIIVVPVWDQAQGEGDNATYHIIAFASVQILGYQLPAQNRITVQFLAYVTCGGSSPGV